MIETMVIAVLSGLLFMSTCLAFMQWVRARRAESYALLLELRMSRVQVLLKELHIDIPVKRSRDVFERAISAVMSAPCGCIPSNEDECDRCPLPPAA